MSETQSSLLLKKQLAGKCFPKIKKSITITVPNSDLISSHGRHRVRFKVKLIHKFQEEEKKKTICPLFNEFCRHQKYGLAHQF